MIKTLFFVICAYLMVVFLYLYPPSVSMGNQSISIEMWLEISNEEMSFIEDLIREYKNTNANISVRVKNYIFSSLKPQYESHFKRSIAPDIILGVNDWMGEWALAEYIQPLNPWLIENWKDSFPDKLLSGISFDNKIFGLPQRIECLALICNKKLTERIPKTVSELENAVFSLKKQGLYGLMVDYSNFYYHIPWLNAWGEELIDERGNINFNSEAMYKSLTLIKDLLEKGIIDPSSTSEGALHLFSRERCGFLIDGPWVISNLNNMDIAIAPIPEIAGIGRARPYLGYKLFMLNSTSKYPKEATELALFLSRKIWEKNNENHKFSSFAQIALDAKDMPNHPKMKEVWAFGNVLLDRALRKGEKIEGLLWDIQDEIDAISQ